MKWTPKCELALVLIVALLLAAAPPALAQTTDPCASTALTTQTTSVGPNSIGWCNDLKDANGNAVTVKGWAVIVDNAAPQPLTATQSASPGATSGQYYFTAPYTVTKGWHTVVVQLQADDGLGGTTTVNSSPLSLGGKNAPPKAPDKVRVGG